MDVHAQDVINQVPTLQTARLTLRTFRWNDAPVVVEALNVWNVTQWLTRVPFPYAQEDFDWFIREMCSDPDDTIWAMDIDGQMIGTISLGGELGYWLHPHHHGHGYMSEAAQAVCAWHFDQSDETIRSGYHVGNKASANVLRKLGFVDDVLDRNVETAHGDTVDTQKVTLSKDQWQARHA